MEEHKPEVDFLSAQGKIVKKPPVPKRPLAKFTIYLLAILITASIAFGYGIVSSGENLSNTFGNEGLWGQLVHLVTSDDKQLAGEEEDRINILLLGMGGENHDGPYLTDTILLISYKPSTEQLAFISIPRDLAAAIPGYGVGKINHANAYGEAQTPGRGGELASRVVSQTFGVPVHYYVRLDFNGFVKIIDDLGGVTVSVDNTLEDFKYPVPGKETATTTERYEHLVIEEGEQRMDGELALKYVRSRSALGIEGSDFARSKRQQNVLLAVKDKALSLSTLTNPYRASRVMDTLSQHLSTNLKVWEVLRLFKMVRDVDQEKVIRQGFDDGPNGHLRSLINEGGAFVLTPRSGNFGELQVITQNIFDPEAVVRQQPKWVEIQNGTKVNGLAFDVSQYLQSLSYQIAKVGNAPTQDYQRSVLYNLGGDVSAEKANELSKLLNIDLAVHAPDWATATSSTKVDRRTTILLILGLDRTTQ